MSGRATFACMDWRSPRSQNGPEPTGGEYVVHHERPYPHRLDRAFRVGAIVAAMTTLFTTVLILHTAVPDHPTGIEGLGIVTALSSLVAALAYGFTRAVGMVAVGIVGGLRRKAYVVDWRDDPPGR